MNRNTKALTRRRELIGAQGVIVHAIIWQPFVMLFTTQTAIARFGQEFGLFAHLYAVSVVLALLLLYLDFLGAIADLYWGRHFTTVKVFVWLDKMRSWFLFHTALWSLMLMTTVKAESGLAAVFSYGLFFVGLACVCLFMALRDGCIENKLQKDSACGNG